MSKKEELINAIFRECQEVEGRKKLSCAQAFELAKQFQVEVMEVGRICNRHNIKIYKCQLGCFK